MKKIKVIVKDSNTLIIDETAKQGDFIDLSELNKIDYSAIESVISEGKDKVYNQKLEDYRHTLRLENDKVIEQLKNEIKLLQKDNEYLLKEKENEIEAKYRDKINLLNNELDKLKDNKKFEIDLLKANYKIEINEQKEAYEYKLKEKEDRISEILRQKASLNVKQTGEDLESWCNNEVSGYMQNGLFNCTWSKDNKVVKEDDEVKGSKADYIFKVFASENHLDNELLTSVCLEMKDENPDSINKKSNADYYKQLDKNRMKKECKYAVLVSTLESDKPNDLPMFKVNEYKDMYVVRPAYLMTFLNMIVSLTSRFKELIIIDKKEKLELKKSLDLMEEFNKLKSTYLDKPLEQLEKNVMDILKQNESIRNASNKINEICEKTINSYIKDIDEKLNKFEIKINKEYKKNS